MMEGILVLMGILSVIYGAYLLVNDVPLPPAVKGSVLILLGVLLIAIAYIRMKRRLEKETRGTGVGYA